MRRAATVLLASLAVAGAAGAATLVEGTVRGDLLLGTRGADTVTARAGPDRIVVWGEGRRDRVSCGPGQDLVNAERNDRIAADCETIARQISRDRSAAPGAQLGTQAEPHGAARGGTIVTVFQTGRFPDGGAAAVGFSTSRDGGVSWREGLLPPAPGYERQSDPVVAYDATRGAWLATTLALSEEGATALLVSRSADGVAWSPPVVAAAETNPEAGLDKQWLACDDGATSPYRGRCYLAYTDTLFPTIAVQSSTDGGLTWTQPAYKNRTSPEGAVGALPVIRPNGDLLVLYTDGTDGVSLVRSTDGGERLRSVAAFPGSGDAAELPGVRAPVLPAAAVDASGRVTAVWHGCARRPTCDGNDVLLSESADGVEWSAPRRLPTAGTGSTFIPTIAIDPASGRIGVLYYAATGCDTRCRIDAWLLESPDGRTWSQPLRLSARTMELDWLARTTQGAMLADYVSLSYAGGRPIAVLALAQEPLPGRLRQAIFAVTRVAPALRRR